MQVHRNEGVAIHIGPGVPAILLMGLVLSGCVSSSEPPSQPVPPANLGSTQAAPPVPPAAIPAALPPGYTRHITYSDGRFTLPDGSTVPADPKGGFTISTGAYIPPRRSRRNHSPERRALHFGQCAGLLLPLRPPRLGDCCLQAGCSTDSPPPACPLSCYPLSRWSSHGDSTPTSSGKAKNGITAVQLRRQAAAMASYLRPQTEVANASRAAWPASASLAR